MAMKSVHFAYYIFLLTFCIGEGDGRWKKADRENLQRDIKLYKKITERVERELQEYYAEYEDHGLLNFNVNRNYYETNRNIPKSSGKSFSVNEQNKKGEPFLSRLIKITNNKPIHNHTTVNNLVASDKIGNIHAQVIDQRSKWPKFEDMLLAIGKKYDWKNDRWIKVRNKFKNKDKDAVDVENIVNHEKHRFNYKTIKLNRGKNKRNVVIAVTAIR